MKSFGRKSSSSGETGSASGSVMPSDALTKGVEAIVDYSQPSDRGASLSACADTQTGPVAANYSFEFRV
jgi:hypothetical protein